MTLKEHVALHDREIAAIRKLILTGMRMLNRNQTQISDLREMQKMTEEKLQALIDSLRQGGNGHSRRPLR